MHESNKICGQTYGPDWDEGGVSCEPIISLQLEFFVEDPTITAFLKCG